MATNLNTTLYERPYYTSQEPLPPQPWHSPLLPDAPVSPAAPAYPSTLNSIERMEVERWLAASEVERPGILTRCTTRAAILKIGEFATYTADPAIKAWIAASHSATIVQFREYMSDATINNKTTQSRSADATGVGAAKPPAYQPLNTDIP